MNPSVICFLFFCWTAPGVVPDGAGGFVPFTNSRVMPDGSLRSYDPYLDGYPGQPPAYGAMPPGYPPGYAPPPQGTVTVGPPEPYAPPTFYDPPPPPVYRAPSRPGRHHAAGKACYDGSGHFVGADNGDCRADPSPDTSGQVEPQ